MFIVVIILNSYERVGYLHLALSHLTKEKEESFKTIKDKDLRIKKILIELEQANNTIESIGKKISELESKLNKKDKLSKKIDKVLSEQTEKKVSESVDIDE